MAVKKYKILKSLILGFLTPQDQFDQIFGPDDDVILESNGNTIWVIKGKEKHESITQAHAIEFYLQKKIIEEIE